MTHFLRRSARILLASAALGALGAQAAVAQPAVAVQPAPLSDATPSMAVAAPGVDAAARTRRMAAPAETYKVRRGDTLGKIADRVGVSIETLAKLNGLKRPYRLDAGQVLKVREAAAPREEARASGSARKSSGGQTYTVKSGDTLFAIAKRFGVSVEALKAENGMGRSSTLARGRKLTIPGAGAPDDAAEEKAPAPEPRASRDRPAGEPVEEAREEVREESAAPGRVITVRTAGKAYRVRRGDNLAEIAGRLDSTVAELARINKLKRPYRLRAGQTIRGPGGTAKAYVVARGDTLASVADRFDVTVDRLRTANGLRRGASLAPGRQLRLPAGYRDRGPGRPPPPAPRQPESSFRMPPPVGQTLPPPRSAQDGLPNAPQPYVPPPRRSTPPSTGGAVYGAPTATPQLSNEQITQMGRGVFEWPLRGAVLSGFGDKGTSQRNDGVNIRANTGDPVRASASGDVVYAGDQVPGFGNLVLIKHADGWVTAYGHLSKVDVRMQQKVTQGQTIGLAGSSGGVSEPQLHFEVRYAPNPQERARPVDPTLVLPR